MSALGHRRTVALQNVMSALPPIATAKANSRKRSCLLYPRKRTYAAHKLMSALGQKRTSLLDHIVSLGKQCGREAHAERIGSLTIYNQLIFGGLLCRSFTRPRSPQHLVGKCSGQSVHLR